MHELIYPQSDEKSSPPRLEKAHRWSRCRSNRSTRLSRPGKTRTSQRPIHSAARPQLAAVQHDTVHSEVNGRESAGQSRGQAHHAFSRARKRQMRMEPPLLLLESDPCKSCPPGRPLSPSKSAVSPPMSSQITLARSGLGRAHVRGVQRHRRRPAGHRPQWPPG